MHADSDDDANSSFKLKNLLSDGWLAIMGVCCRYYGGDYYGGGGGGDDATVGGGGGGRY